MKILGIGHALVDAFAFVDDDLPKTLGLHSGTFNEVPDYRMRAIVMTLKNRTLMAGGSSANIVRLGAQLGLKTYFASRCGNDANGILFESELLQAGVNPFLEKTEVPTGICVTFLTPHRGKTIATFRSASAQLSPSLVSDSLIEEADVVVVEGYLLDDFPFLDSLLHRCKSFQKTVVFDLADVSLVSRNKDNILKLIQEGYIHYLFASEEEATLLDRGTSVETLEKYHKYLKAFVIKRGELGCQLAVDGRVVTVPAIGPVAVDPSGAGDGLQAGFLWGLSQGKSPVECCRAGAIVASHIVQVPGTRLDSARIEKIRLELSAAHS